MNITACQVCSCPDLQMVFDAGFLPAVNVMRRVGESPQQEKFYPAQLFLCGKCQLVQLGNQPAHYTEVFPASYPYRSGCTKTLLKNFMDLVGEIVSSGYGTAGDLVCDVGCNDGSLLKFFGDAGFELLGIEPTDARKDAEEADIRVAPVSLSWDVVDYWLRKFDIKRKAKIVTACNVFAHMPDVHDALNCVLEILADDGVFVIEAHYLMTMLSRLQFDTIYSEHCRYYSLTSLKYLLEMYGMEIVHVKRTEIHGGSIRVYAARKYKHEVRSSVGDLLAEEASVNMGFAIERFASGSKFYKGKLWRVLSEAAGTCNNCFKLYGIGAPSRATTLIHYAGLDSGILDCVCEQTGSKKIGYYIPGTSIPVTDEAKLYEDQPPYAMILSWHLADEIIGKLRQKGYRGKFVVPLPYPGVED